MDFPFEQGKPHTIGQLRTFASQIQDARKGDQQLSAKMRVDQLPWAKDWKDELSALRYFADRKKLSDDETFIWTQGEPFDFKVTFAGKTLKLQVTVAFPAWSVIPANSSAGHGYVHAREMKHLNEHGHSFGGGLVSQPRARSYEEDLRAWRDGIKAALQNKLLMCCEGLRLLVFAPECWFNNIDFNFAVVVRPAIDAVAWADTFEAVYVLDAHESAFVEVCAIPRRRHRQATYPLGVDARRQYHRPAAGASSAST